MSENQENKQAVEKAEKKTVSLTEFKRSIEREGLRLQHTGEIEFPANYSVGNAVKAALLQIEQTENKDHLSAIKHCTAVSIQQAVLSTLIKGLNPAKGQCYYIVYGDQLTMQPSPGGRVLMAKRANPQIDDIYAQVVYSDDKFSYSFKRGKTVVTQHEQKLGNIDKGKIVAAYATILYRDGHEESVIKTFDEIKQAWRQSQQKDVFEDDGSINEKNVHWKFTAEMCKKTVINAATKPIIRDSDDSDIVSARATAQAEIDEHANKVEAGFSEVPEDEGELPEDASVDIKTGEVKEQEEAPEENKFETESAPDEKPQAAGNEQVGFDGMKQGSQPDPQQARSTRRRAF